jgi:hypothetical protein
MAPIEMAQSSPFKAKLTLAIQLMNDRGIGRVFYAPLLFRLFWLVNIPIRPPHFASVTFNASFYAIAFGVILGLYGCLMIWLGIEVSLAVKLGFMAMALVSGVVNAAYYRYSARKHKLPAWSDLTNEAEIFD